MMEAERIATDLGGAEGPVFSRLGFLLFSDTGKNRIMRWERAKLTVFRENSNGSKGLTFDHQGRLLACEKNRVTRTEKNGTITDLADGAAHDLVYAIDGSIYYSEPSKGRVSQIGRVRGIRVVAEDCTGPTGVALAPNQQKLYVSDHGNKVIRVYAVAADGVLKDSREFASIDGRGLKTDEDGNVWVAAADGIVVFTPRGEKKETVKIPEPPVNLNWGNGFRGLYVTTAASVYHIANKANGTRTF